MKILYILRQEPDATGEIILGEHERTDEVTVIDIREEHNYDRLVDLIASSDSVISW